MRFCELRKAPPDKQAFRAPLDARFPLKPRRFEHRDCLDRRRAPRLHPGFPSPCFVWLLVGIFALSSPVATARVCARTSASAPMSSAARSISASPREGSLQTGQRTRRIVARLLRCQVDILVLPSLTQRTRQGAGWRRRDRSTSFVLEPDVESRLLRTTENARVNTRRSIGARNLGRAACFFQL